MRPWLLPLLLFASSACTASLVQDAGEIGPSILESLEDARAVAIDTADGAVLRGAFLEARPGAPVVLHLLPTATSTRTGLPGGVGRIGLDRTLEVLRESGWSSLVLDYRGVGASTGERDSNHLRADGRAMWDEALRRSGGKPERVVLRAASLGTLVAADLLQVTGETPDPGPAGAVLFAPIDATTVVRNAGRDRLGSLGGWWAEWTHRTPNFPALGSVTEASQAPLLIVLPADDLYLPPGEAEVLRERASRAGQRVVTLEGEHARCVLRAWNFDIDVGGFAARRTHRLLDAEARFLEGLGLTAADR